MEIKSPWTMVYSEYIDEFIIFIKENLPPKHELQSNELYPGIKLSGEPVFIVDDDTTGKRLLIDFINEKVSAILIDTGAYPVDLVNDADLGDVPAEAVLSSVSLTGNTLDESTFRADSVTFPQVPTGKTAGAIVLAVNAETYSESTLIAYIDNAPEFPLDTDGSDIVVNWDANGIFSF